MDFLRPIAVASLALLLGVAGCDLGSGIDGNGNVTQVNVDSNLLDGVERVELQSSATLRITIDPDAEPSLVVRTDENLQEFIEVKSADGRLSIGTQGDIDPSDGVSITMVAPSLSGVILSGSGDIHVGDLDAERFEASLAGSGEIKLKGSVAVVELAVSGSGEIDASDLSASDAVATVSGSGDIKVSASQSVEAKVTGSGDIEIEGSPTTVNQTVTGSGEVSVE